MLTIQEAQEYLDSVGINLPAFILAALVEQVNTIVPCLEANYPSASTRKLILAYLLGLMALGQGDRYISSQTAPSGASRSFRYQSFADRWKGGLSLLRGLDVHGCASGLIPADPTRPKLAFMAVSTGGCDE